MIRDLMHQFIVLSLLAVVALPGCSDDGDASAYESDDDYEYDDSFLDDADAGGNRDNPLEFDTSDRVTVNRTPGTSAGNPQATFGDATRAPAPAVFQAAPGHNTPTASAPAPAAGIVINGQPITAQQLQEFKTAYGAAPPPGRYWYDTATGMHGPAGQPPAGFMRAGHGFAPLPADASAGDTGVFFNGRELGRDEQQLWSLFIGGNIQPGRYWLNAKLNVGLESNRFQSVNLIQLAQLNGTTLQKAQQLWNQAGFRGYAQPGQVRSGGGGHSGGGGGDNFWSTRFSAGNHNGQGQGYVSVPGYGPIGYGF